MKKHLLLPLLNCLYIQAIIQLPDTLIPAIENNTKNNNYTSDEEITAQNDTPLEQAKQSQEDTNNNINNILDTSNEEITAQNNVPLEQIKQSQEDIIAKQKEALGQGFGKLLQNFALMIAAQPNGKDKIKGNFKSVPNDYKIEIVERLKQMIISMNAYVRAMTDSTKTKNDLITIIMASNLIPSSKKAPIIFMNSSNSSPFFNKYTDSYNSPSFFNRRQYNDELTGTQMSAVKDMTNLFKQLLITFINQVFATYQ